MSVHLDTNAIGLPFGLVNESKLVDTVSLNKYMDEISDHWTIYGFDQNLLNTSEVLPPIEETLWKSIHSDILFDHDLSHHPGNFDLFRKSIVLLNLTNVNVVLNTSDLAHINEKKNVFLAIKIDASSVLENQIKSLHVTIIDENSNYVEIKITVQRLLQSNLSNHSVIINLELCGLLEFNSSFNCYKYLPPHLDSNNQGLLYHKLKGPIEMYDGIGGIKGRWISRYQGFFNSVSSLSIQSGNHEYFPFSCTIVQLPDLVVSDRSIFKTKTSLIDQNKYTLRIVYYKKLHAELEVQLYHGFNKKRTIKPDNILQVSTKHSLVDEIVLAQFSVYVPSEWYSLKWITVNASKNVYITHMWLIESVENKVVLDYKTCGSKSDITDIYDVAFKDPPAKKEVPHCSNGGLLDDSTKTCRCPPGFRGETCDVPCGRNKFGQECTNTCSDTETECRGMILCTPAYNCSCAPGSRGEYCLDECFEGTYLMF